MAWEGTTTDLNAETLWQRVKRNHGARARDVAGEFLYNAHWLSKVGVVNVQWQNTGENIRDAWRVRADRVLAGAK